MDTATCDCSIEDMKQPCINGEVGDDGDCLVLEEIVHGKSGAKHLITIFDILKYRLPNGTLLIEAN